ncbi:MAG: zinc-binding dehydrogenase [Alphaproteobacteria bacterium]|nr:zinc-binding dehydrogenase [Alphaproteobacteria bacterium]
MKQIWIPKTGEPSVLDVREAPDPVPGPGQVRIAVAAAGVNFADVMARMGLYQDAPPLPCVVGYEVSGTIDAVGDGVDAGRVGDRVVAMTRFGGYSTAVVVDAVNAIPLPDAIDFATGAAIPVNGLTAWMILDVMGRVREGDRVLVHSAGGGVGLMALDLILEAGATAVGTASGHKHDWLRERGFHELVDYTQVDFEEALADGPGFDLILDPIGGESWAKGLRLLRAGGRLAMFGMSASTQGGAFSFVRTALKIPFLQLVPPAIINANKGAFGVNMGRLWDDGDRVRVWMDALLERVVDGRLRPVVHAQVPFDTPAEAHAILHRRENIGKVVLVT